MSKAVRTPLRNVSATSCAYYNVTQLKLSNQSFRAS